MNRYKKVNILLLISSLVASAIGYGYWKMVCTTNSCSYDLIKGLLEPLEKSGYVLTIFFIVFLFLPSSYFESWLKRIFSWAFPLSLLIVAGTQDSSSILAFSRALVVQLLGAFFGIVTLLFITLHFLHVRKPKK